MKFPNWKWDILTPMAGVGLTVALAAALFFLFSSPADALSDPLGRLRVYTFACGTSAAQIMPTGAPRSAKAMRIWNNSTTPVYLGGADVNTSTLGWPICTDASVCEQPAFPIDSNPVVYCVAGSTVNVKVFLGY